MKLSISLIVILALLSACISVAPVSGPVSPAVAPHSLVQTIATPASTPAAATALPTFPPPSPGSGSPTPPPAASRLDVQTQFSLLSLPGAGHAPNALAQLGPTIYVTNHSSANIGVVKGGKVQSFIPLSSDPTAIAADPDGNRIYAGTYTTPTLFLIEDGLIKQQAMTGGHINALAFHDGLVYVALDSNAVIERYDATTLAKKDSLKLSDGFGVSALAVDAPRNRLYAVIYGKIVAIDLAAFRELNTIAVPTLYATIAVNPADGSVWAGGYDDTSSRSYVVGFASDGRQIAQAFIGADLRAAAFDDASRLYVLDHFDNKVYVLQAPEAQLVATLDANLSPSAALYDLSSKSVIFANQDSDNLSVIDTKTPQVTGVIPLAINITALASNPANNHVYAANGSTNSVFVLQGEQVVGEVKTGAVPVDLAVDPDSGRVYVASVADGKLTVFDDNTLQVQTSQFITDSLTTVAVDPVNHKLFAGSYELDPTTLASQAIFFAQGVTLDSKTVPTYELVNPNLKKLYAFASNAVPGSNSRETLYRFLYNDLSQSKYLGSENGGNLTAMAVDTATNMLYATDTHPLAYTHGLDVYDAQDNRVSSLRFPAQTTAMAVNPTTHHLFLAHAETYLPGSDSLAPGDNTVEILDTRTLGHVASVPVSDPWRMTLHGNLVYVSAREDGTISIIHDFESAQPPAPSPTLTPTPYPTFAPVTPASLNTTPTPIPTGTLTTTVNIACSYGPNEPFAAQWLASEAMLGCPTGRSTTGNFAIQTFRDGFMFDDLRDPDAQKIYALLPDHTFRVYDDTWKEGEPERPCNDVEIPQGRIHPKRGFGKVWCDNPDLQTALPGAVADEHAITFEIQPFEHGMMWASPPGSQIFVLFDDDTWK